MPRAHQLSDVTPALSIQPVNFAGKDPGVGGWRWLFETARGADAAGIDRLVVSDHVILGENLDAYSDPSLGGTEGGKQPTGPDGQWLEPLTVLSMMAAVTERTRLMTGILIASLRSPATLAKQLSTMDVLSEGRIDIGVGVGWQREEYQANGLPWKRRGARLDQTLDVCQTLWENESAAYQSEEVNFEKVHCNPKPLQQGGVPFWISGTLNRNVLRRIARFGSGWIPWGPDAMNPVAGLARIREELEKAGRSSEGFQVASYIPVAMNADKSLDIEKTMSAVPGMVEAGITDLRLQCGMPQERAALEDFLAPAVAAFRQAAGRSS